VRCARGEPVSVRLNLPVPRKNQPFISYSQCSKRSLLPRARSIASHEHSAQGNVKD
jgi:hypothetical protein